MAQSTKSSTRKSSFPPIVYFAVALFIAYGGHQLWKYFQPLSLADRSSLGEKLLIKTVDSQDKSEGIKNFAKGDYTQAISHFQASLRKQPNDPETKIYLTNSLAIEKVGDIKKLKKIAVVVPIGSNLNVAQELLRGFAQVQEETARQGGIKGSPIAIEIYNDENKAELAKQIASKTTSDPQVLAVIGSNASDPSLAAAPIYQQAGLVMVSPSSMTRDLSGIGSYIFRTVPSSKALATTLAQQIIQVDRKHKLAICSDSSAVDNVSFKDDLMTEFARMGGEVASITCDISATDFNPTIIIDKVINSGADALFISSHIDRLPQAFQLAQANRGRLTLFSSPTLNTFQTLQQGNAIAGLTLVTPWQNPLNVPSGSFADRARQLWGGQVSWRTAMSFDAAVAIVTGLQQSDGTRQGLQEALHNPQFNANGASGMVKFLPTGDRELPPTITQVQQRNGKWVFGIPLSLKTVEIKK